MYTHGIGAVRKKTLVGAPLVVSVGDTNPENNPASLNCTLEVSGVPRNEPMAKRMLEARRACRKPFHQAIGQGPRRAGDQFGVAGERQGLNRHRLLVRCHDGLAGEQALQRQTIEAVQDETTSAKVAQCFAHLRPALERANRKTQLGLLGQRKPRMRWEIDERLGSLFHEGPSRFDADQGRARPARPTLSTTHIVPITHSCLDGDQGA